MGAERVVGSNEPDMCMVHRCESIKGQGKKGLGRRL